MTQIDPSAGAISFQLLAEIAFGATARIDLCRALGANRPGIEGQLLAVKRLHPHIAEDPGFAAQFLDEVWMTAALKSPNVVEVRGWGTDEQGGYLAVELVQGVALARLMKTVFETGEVFSERMVVFIASRLCRGLAAAHGLRAHTGELLNLVHRDLTPANVLCGFNGDVKIADFGMAKAKQRLTKTLTGMRKGEPTYMAPEQARADEIDARADLFALGVILFELFAGRRPWLAKSDFEMVQVTARDPPADLRELRPKIDKELVNIVNKCLEKDPAHRFQSAAEIGDRLENWLTVHGYQEGNEDALARFVRRNAMKQMRWFERAVAGELAPKPKVGRNLPPRVPTYVDTNERLPKASVEPRPPPPPPAAGARPRPPLPTTPLPNASAPPQMAPLPASASPRLASLPASASPRLASPAAAPLRSPIAAPPQAPIAAAPPIPAAGMHRQPAPAARMAPPAGVVAARPAPDLDDEPGEDETDITDDAWRVARQVQASPPVITAMQPAAEPDWGEEVPTLVQSGSAEIEALRKSARPRPQISVSRPMDDDTDMRTTAVKNLGGAISDMDSEQIPTEPVRSADVHAMQQRIPAARRSEPTRSAMSPLAGSSRLSPKPPLPPPSPSSPEDASATGPLPSFAAPSSPLPSFGTPSSPSFGVAPPYEMQDPGKGAFGPARGASADDVEVIDRGRKGKTLNEEALVAEADRMAIEAVRRTEEARAAAARAERKAQVAKMANDAAMIAADAVRVARSMGLAAASKRLEEARQIEQAMDRPESAASAGVAALGKAPPPSFEGLGPAASVSASSLPNAASQGFFAEAKATAPPATVATSPFAAHASPQGAFSAETPMPGSGQPFRPAVTGAAGALDVPVPRFRPQVFGMPPLAIAGLGIVAFCIVFLVLWLFFG